MAAPERNPPLDFSPACFLQGHFETVFGEDGITWSETTMDLTPKKSDILLVIVLTQDWQVIPTMRMWHVEPPLPFGSFLMVEGWCWREAVNLFPILLINSTMRSGALMLGSYSNSPNLSFKLTLADNTPEKPKYMEVTCHPQNHILHLLLSLLISGH